eukprot:CAMPEP_0184478254 /NCGR_PEP_ID=MMETSP0113_2-20130426/322_1 /TAXON_ID=91329 /ORGANISM="Norrisiella sphaerica, Strain BC52" /LENGTH=346 /DNA_ID=CAMNT_0026855965 /DNA_START=226 /DNA_END=1266 /DNA_ORIENTATION=+
MPKKNPVQNRLKEWKVSRERFATGSEAYVYNEDANEGLLNYLRVKIKYSLARKEGAKPLYAVQSSSNFLMKMTEDLLVPLPKALQSSAAREKYIFGGLEREDIRKGLFMLPEGIIKLVISFLEYDRVDMKQVEVLGCSSRATPNINYSFDPKGTVSPGTDACWISGRGSCPKGSGREYVTYKLRGKPCVLHSVAMRIPSDGPLSVRKFHLEASTNTEADESPPPTNWTGDITGRAAEEYSKREELELSQVISSKPGSKDWKMEGKKNAEKQVQKAKENMVETMEWKRASPDFNIMRGPSVTHPIQEFVLDPPVICTHIRVVCTQNQQGSEECPHFDSIGFWEVVFH